MAIQETEVKINGVDISAFVSKWKVMKTFGQSIPECEIVFPESVKNTLTILNGQTITIKRGSVTATDDFIFEGIVDEVTDETPAVKILGKQKLIELLRNEITKSYDIDIDPEAGVGSEIFKDMVNTFTLGALTADNTSVVSTGALDVITKFICNHVDIFPRAKVLAEIYNYQIYYLEDDSLVHFEPCGFVDKTSEPLEVGVNVHKSLKFQLDNSQCVNDLTVEGAVQETEVTESFDGDASTTVFTLANVPIRVRVDVDSSPETLGVPDSTAVFDFSVDKESKQVRFEVASTPGSGTDNVVATYTTARPVPVRVTNSTSITDFGRYRMTKHFPDVQTVDDARNRGRNFVNKFGEPFTRVKVQVINTATLVKVGELRRVIDAQNNKDQVLDVSSVIYQWPETTDVVHCGNRAYKTREWESNTSERIKRLEEELVKNQDLLIQVEQSNPELEVHSVHKISARDYTGTTFLVWDHPQFGDWDDFDWITDIDVDIGPLVQQRLVWSGGTYFEDFFDEVLKDATTTATWDTSAHEISFGVTTFALSEIVYENDETYVSVDVTITFTGAPVFKVSTDDGATFTTVAGITSGVVQNVPITSTQGKKVIWRADGTSGDTITEISLRPITA